MFLHPLADRPALLLSSLLVVLGMQLFALGLLGELIIFTHARDIKDYQIEEVVRYPEGVVTEAGADERCSDAAEDRNQSISRRLSAAACPVDVSRIQWTLTRLRVMSPSEIGFRVGRKIQGTVERAGIGLARPSLPEGTCGKPWLAQLPGRFESSVTGARPTGS